MTPLQATFHFEARDAAHEHVYLLRLGHRLVSDGLLRARVLLDDGMSPVYVRPPRAGWIAPPKTTSDVVLFQGRPDSYLLDFPKYDFLLVCVEGREWWMRRTVMHDPVIGEWILELTGVFRD